MLKFILSVITTSLTGIGAYYALSNITNNPVYLLISVIISILCSLTYTALWYKEVDMIEHTIINNQMYEDRIPVIGSRLIDWELELDIPIYDINHPIKFDRNKIIYEPKKPT
jgi:uncharacterized membrane protein